jgi:hypothetical protein
MSSLWTPSGEHPVDDERAQPQVAPVMGEGPGELSDEEAMEAEAQVEALRQRLAEAPVETVLANHCYGLFELGAVYLSATPAMLPQARMAIDAFGLLVEGLGDRLGEAAGPLRDALAQIRLGYVQVEGAHQAADADADSGE